MDEKSQIKPAAPGCQQMRMHIDVAVDELAAAVASAIALGMTLAVFLLR